MATHLIELLLLCQIVILEYLLYPESEYIWQGHLMQRINMFEHALGISKNIRQGRLQPANGRQYALNKGIDSNCPKHGALSFQKPARSSMGVK